MSLLHRGSREADSCHRCTEGGDKGGKLAELGFFKVFTEVGFFLKMGEIVRHVILYCSSSNFKYLFNYFKLILY
ncbi:MAG: hypothetical protein ACTSWC_04810 [Promethearchaeota archaeon]